MNTEKFYTTVVTVTLLHTKPLNLPDLYAVANALEESGVSGTVDFPVENAPLTRTDFTLACSTQGTDLDYFGIEESE